MKSTRGTLVALVAIVMSCTRPAPSVPSPASGGSERPAPRSDTAAAATGSVDLPSGLRVSWELHYDRNALVDLRPAGAALIALTSAGQLLRFDRSSLELLSERAGPGVVTCLGVGPGGELLAGLESGEIGRVDPSTLALTYLADVERPPTWIGADARGLVAVVSLGPPEALLLDSISEVIDLASGRRTSLEFAATSLLLDSHHRLWVGMDQGEFGGRIASVELETGVVVDVARRIEGVYGFLEDGDGVLAHGGLIHMNAYGGYLVRCSGDQTAEVAMFERGDPDRPAGPLTHLLRSPDGGLIALFYGRAFRVDPSLTRWTPLAELELRHHAGRPDALSSYPAVARALLETDGSLSLATRRDGLVRVRPGGPIERFALPGQLETNAVRRVAGSEVGLTLFDGPDAAVWYRRDQAWESVPLYPPGPLPARTRWWEASVHLAPDGSLLSVVKTNASLGRCAVVRWSGGAQEILGDWAECELSPSEVFITPDGALWNAALDGISRFEGGAWAPVVTGERDPGRDLLAVGALGPPWVLLDRNHHFLLRFDPSVGLTPLMVVDERGPLAVLDALEGADGTLLEDEVGALLLATDRGIRGARRSSCETERSLLPPGGSYSHLARDGQGRLWLGGEGLWLRSREDELIPLEAVPVLGQRRTTALGADPDHPDGMVVATWGAVALLRVP